MNANNILVITSIYPGEGTPSGFTPVVHYFVKEWVKMGYGVRVIHACTYFPSIYYKAPQWVRRIAQNRIGIALPEKKLNKESEYEYEGVKVYRIPMKKMMPMSNYSENVLNKACLKAEKYIKKIDFYPEHIISHWLNPQLVLMSHIKSITGATATMVLHGAGPGMESPFSNWKQLIANVDIWGYRSIKIKNSFESACGIQRYSFRCFSGIPSYYTENVPQRDGIFRYRFVQVGLLIERKFPDITIDAVTSVYEEDNFILNIIGDGSMKDSLDKKIKELAVQDKVCLMGRLSRQEIIPILDQSDVFILISKQEVFGLVYIEAMARGCIVIASRGEGMEGVINDKVNGFLCEAGNEVELTNILKQIRDLTNEERKRISEAAKATSLKLTDVAVAKDYIETVVGYGEMINNNCIDEKVYHTMSLSVNSVTGG